MIARSDTADFKDESFFGRAPSRFNTLEDEEGREVDFRSKDFSSGRSPASVKPRMDDAAEPTRVERELNYEESAREARAASSGNDEEVVTTTTETRVYSRPAEPKPRAGKNRAETQGRSIASMRSDGAGGGGIRSGDTSGSNGFDWATEDTRLRDPFAGADSVTRRKGVQEVSIIANDLGFFPKTIFVSRNIPVRLYVTGASKNSTCLMMDAFNVRKQLKANKVEEITFVPNQPGAYRFYCPVNNSDGTMVVKELSP